MSIKPRLLRKGDRIGVLAPSGPVKEPELREGIEALESLGFPVVLSAHTFEQEGYLAGPDACRMQELHGMFRDERLKAIICARGGYGVMRLFEKMDFDLVRKHPKILVGYSDITALLLALYRKTRLVTIHGPVIKNMGANQGRNLESLLRLLTSREPVTLKFTGTKALKKGLARGTLMGGNLTLLTHLAGTPFMPPLRGALLFLEEKGEEPYRVDRMLTHLRLAGVFERCAGIMIGSFEGCGESAEVEALIEERLGDLDVPVITGIPVGHGEENVALPIGVRAELDAVQGTLALSEACVRA